MARFKCTASGLLNQTPDVWYVAEERSRATVDGPAVASAQDPTSTAIMWRGIDNPASVQATLRSWSRG